MARKTASTTDELNLGDNADQTTLNVDTAAATDSQAAASQTTDIAEYQPHEAEIVRVEQTYGKLVVDCSTSKGLEDAKKVRVDIRAVRYALDKTKKVALVPYQQAVKDAQARVNEVKDFGEKLVERVLAVETPIDDAIKAEEKRQKDEKDRLAEIERQRVDKITGKITHFRSVAAAYVARSAEDIAAMLERVKVSVILPEEYEEFEGEATIARDAAIEQLEVLHKTATDREQAEAKLKAQQEAFEAQQRELEELRRKNQEEQDRRAEEDRKRLADQQAELDRQRQALAQQQEEQRQRDEKYQRDQEELARLRAQAAAPVATTAPVQAAVTAPVPSAHIHQAPDVAASPTVTQAAPEPAAVAEFVSTEEDGPSAQEIVEVVAMSFDMSEDAARALLKATQF